MKHRTLVLSVDPPWPPISGVDLRNWQNVTALAELGTVTVASLLPLAITTPPPNPNIEIVGLTKEGERRRDAFDRRRTSIDQKIPKSAISDLSQFVSEIRPDAVIVEGIGLHPLLTVLRPLARHLILDMHNIESDLAGQERAARFLSGNWLGRILDRNPERIRDAEVAATRIVDSVWVCSMQDRGKLAGFVGDTVRTYIVPNGVPRSAEFSAPLSPAPTGEDGPVILFVGHLAYGPNVRAVKRLAEDILPLVRGRLPRSRLLVVGRNPAPQIMKLSASGVIELVATPREVSKYLKQAHLVVVPLELGGGTRIKILEAMAAGVPVVATPVAAEGLDVIDGTHILLARTDWDLASGVESLVSNLDRWHRQREIARSYVMNTYGPAAISQSLRKGLGSLPTDTCGFDL